MGLPDANPVSPAPARSASWNWLVCGLLLLATMLNYMDRLTLNQTSKRIIEEFQLTNEMYGQVESAFAIAFALGALIGGWMVDRWNVWWVYPAVVLAWSVAGWSTGYAASFAGLLVCRSFLGFFEAGHWPCALRTTQRILDPARRTLGNSILQSGAAIGAILTPLVVIYFVARTNTWRYPFFVVGGLGIFWVVLWLVIVRRRDLALPSREPLPSSAAGGQGDTSFGSIFRDHRFWLLILVVLCINVTWHYFRVWLPLFLQKTHGYSEVETNLFTSAYYLSTDLGSLFAGFGTLYLARRGMTVHGSRLFIFFFCALLTTLSLLAGVLPAGTLLLGILLVIGFGALGLFPTYYSFSQELTVRHQGKLTGILGCANWIGMAALQWLVGLRVDQTGSHAEILTFAGLAPLVGFFALLLFWGTDRKAGVERKGQKPSGAEAPTEGEGQPQGQKSPVV